MNRILKYLYVAITLTTGVLLSGCDVHEWPKTQNYEPYGLHLKFETDFPQWEHYIDTRADALPETKAPLDYGLIRYIVRAYPLHDGTVDKAWSDEFVFMRDAAEGYDCDLQIELKSGSYRLIVWSDIFEREGTDPYYSAEDFGEISLQGTHAPNTDYRDAFRGSLDVEVQTSIDEHTMPMGTITMQRPLAKFEFVSNDLIEFFEREARNAERRLAEAAASAEKSTLDAPQTHVSLDDYEIVFSYVGFMPNAYSIFTDKPVDSATGVQFRSNFTQLSDEEASLGFDYVFVNGSETAVTVQIALYSPESATPISLTEPIYVPLRRSSHTVIRGSFLMTQASGGTGIDPGYDGNHNVILP